MVLAQHEFIAGLTAVKIWNYPLKFAPLDYFVGLGPR